MTTVTKSATTTSSATVVSTAAVNMTGMTMLCVYAINFGTTFAATPITDSSSNTYTLIATQTANSQQQGLWYCLSPTVTSTMTFSAHTTGSTGGLGVAVIGWDGASPTLDQGSTSTFGSNASGTTLTTPSITTTSANELLVTCYTNNDGTDTVSIASAGSTSATFTIDESIDGSSGQRVTLAHAIVSVTGTYAATWTTNQNSAANDGIASFKTSGGAAQDTPELYGRPDGLGGQRTMIQLLAQ